MLWEALHGTVPPWKADGYRKIVRRLKNPDLKVRTKKKSRTKRLKKKKNRTKRLKREKLRKRSLLKRKKKSLRRRKTAGV